MCSVSHAMESFAKIRNPTFALNVLVSVSMTLSQTRRKYSLLLATLMLQVIFIHTSSGQKII